MHLIDMNIPKSVPKLFADRVAHWDDERSIGNSLIVTLKDGWYWPQEGRGCHVRGFDTLQDAVSDLRATKLCCCAVCVGADETSNTQ